MNEKHEPKASIGQEINTDGFGQSIVRNVYYSYDCNSYVYEVSPTENVEQHFLVFEEDML